LLTGGIGVAILLAIVQAQTLKLSPQEWSRAKFGDRLLLSQQAAKLINNLLLPEESFFQWGHYAELYYYSGRTPPAAELRSRQLFSGWFQTERTVQLLSDLEESRPELIVLVAGHEFPQEHPVPSWIMKNYSPLSAPPCDASLGERFLFLARRDGRLQATVSPGSCLGAPALPLHGRGWYTTRDVFAQRAQPAHHLRRG
jgi:hypothetical protein